MKPTHTVIVGAGIGGLVAAVELAAAGQHVTVVERAAASGGKLREVQVNGQAIDSGPTVFTMADIFEDIFRRAGTRLDDQITLRPAEVLARHAWGRDDRLDLHADIEQSVAAIAAFAGRAEARRYRDFCRQAKRVFDTLDGAFMRTANPTPASLASAGGWRGLIDLWQIRPFSKLWPVLGEYFHDPRLRQLFARYATYCGSDPYQATATLLLIAHVEHAGVWRIEGGMYRLGEALERVARGLGAVFRFDAEVARIDLAGDVKCDRAAGVTLASGERIDADAVIANVEVRALADGLLGEPATASVDAPSDDQRSLSAVTWSAFAKTRGFELKHHNVFFGADYAGEFRDIFEHRRLPQDPTIYICAQDREGPESFRTGQPERLLILANAPSTLGAQPIAASAIDDYRKRCIAQLARAGLEIDLTPDNCMTTTPQDFAALFPGSAGMLYGQAAHGWQAPFSRPTARSRIAGLYLAGGSVHPGAGVPMAALSGSHAARTLLADAGLGTGDKT